MRRLFAVVPILTMLIASCGQQEPVPSNDNVSTNNRTQAAVVIPKLPRTLTTDEYTNIYCGIVDRSGNLWFGSSGEGLYRFDGNTFTQFTTADGLSTNVIRSLLEDQMGNIWIGTTDGICKYNGVAISKVPIVVPDPSVLINPDKRYKNEIWSLLQDKTGKIWIGTSVGMFTYDGTRFLRFPNDYVVVSGDKYELKMVDDILQDRNGNIWFASGTTEGATKYDGDSLVGYQPNGDEWVRTLMEDQQGIIWSNGRHNGVSSYKGIDFIKFSEKEKIGSAMLQDRSGNIWFSGEEHENGYAGVDGVWRYDGKKFTNFNAVDGIGDYGVWCIVEDLKGNIWFGTRNNGLYKYNGASFECYSE